MEQREQVRQQVMTEFGFGLRVGDGRGTCLDEHLVVEQREQAGQQVMNEFGFGIGGSGQSQDSGTPDVLRANEGKGIGQAKGGRDIKKRKHSKKVKHRREAEHDREKER